MNQKVLAALAAIALQLATVNTQAESTSGPTPQKNIQLRVLREPIPAENLLDGSYIITQREAALRYCLNINYEKIGAYRTEDLKDYSEIEKTLSIEKGMALTKFIERKTGHFYTENLPIQMEKAPPYNAIFARCMHFYHSRELSEFIFNLESNK